MSVLVVSPHLDDAVFSCGALLADRPGARVVTVFAGRPRATALTDWDRDCGFAAGDDVVGSRRVEDQEACARLAATPIWLDFVDGQYGETMSVDGIEASLRAFEHHWPGYAGALKVEGYWRLGRDARA